MRYPLNNYIPLVRIRPLKTFNSRIKWKLRWCWKLIRQIFLVKIFLQGAHPVGKIGQLELIKLNKTSSLGSKGDFVCLLRDQVIYRSVVMEGQWEIQTSKFLADQLMSHPGSTLVDLGANQGLITKQVLNKLHFEVSAILVEPLPAHILASRINLSNFQHSHSITFVEGALDIQSGNRIIYSDNVNFGNTTFSEYLIPMGRSIGSTITTLSIKEFEENYLADKSQIVIKSDMQGFDLTFLITVSIEIWQKVVAASIEVWAVVEVNQAIKEEIRIRLSQFSSLVWVVENQNTPTTVDEVLEYWGRNDGTWRDLYVS